jgi:hypothetical protein
MRDYYKTGGFQRVTLHNGRVISLIQYIVSPTYKNLLVGRPTSDLDEFILKELPSRMTAAFGKWPVQVLGASNVTTPEGNSHLPLIQIGGVFNSFWGGHDERCSRLIMVWHQNEVFPVLSEHTLKAIEAVDWEAMAEEYDV